MSDPQLQLFSNNAISLLSQNLGEADLSIELQSGMGELFPIPSLPGEWFVVTLESIAAPFLREIVKIVGRVGDTLIVDPSGRAQEGTIAQNWTMHQTLVDHRLTADTLKKFSTAPTISINGDSTSATIGTGQTASLSPLPIVNNKSCKWLVTVETDDDRICSIEILAVYKATGPIFNKYSKVGDSVSFGVDVIADASNMILSITNTDIANFSVDIIRIQHNA